eukprot:Phypoly_transcript_05186.p1 GENE.Phypoly_transcript_05186~~Phypoly_transcript_05186.p1  ORF type:complete len:586 (+),score=89.56 Phypoly_transcript_05186:190-1947(+)
MTVHNWATYKLHLILLLKLSWPNVLTSLISLALPVTSTLAVGHLGSPAFIGAAALGNMFANATGFAVGSGLSMALDTLCSQAFGAKKYRLVGLHCQRAMVILTIGCIPIAIVWYNAWIVLQFIGTEETKEVTDWSQYWIIRLIPSLWPRLMYEAYRRYLLAQRVMWPLTVSVALIVPIHVLNTFSFVYYFNFGFEGAVYATDISYWLLFGTLVLMSQLRLWYLRRRVRNHKHAKLQEMDDLGASDDDMTLENSLELDNSVMSADESEGETPDGANEIPDEGDALHTWPAWSFDVFRGWIGFMKLGVATTLSLMIEWGSFEVNAAIAARLGEIPLAAHAIMCNSVSVWYSFPLGVANASSALVGNLLGAGEPERAKIIGRIAFCIALVYGVCNGGLGLLYRDFLGMAFTNDKAVVQLISSMMTVMWLYGLVDAIKAVGMAILRGSGRPKLTVYGNVLSCLVVGYPVALLMVYKGHFGLQGLWFGMSTAWLTASTVYGIMIARTDWQAEVVNAALRNADAENSTKRGKAENSTKSPDWERPARGGKEALLSVSVKSVNGDEEGEGEGEGGENEKRVFLGINSPRGEE